MFAISLELCKKREGERERERRETDQIKTLLLTVYLISLKIFKMKNQASGPLETGISNAFVSCVRQTKRAK